MTEEILLQSLDVRAALTGMVFQSGFRSLLGAAQLPATGGAVPVAEHRRHPSRDAFCHLQAVTCRSDSGGAARNDSPNSLEGAEESGAEHVLPVLPLTSIHLNIQQILLSNETL